MSLLGNFNVSSCHMGNDSFCIYKGGWSPSLPSRGKQGLAKALAAPYDHLLASVDLLPRATESHCCPRVIDGKKTKIPLGGKQGRLRHGQTQRVPQVAMSNAPRDEQTPFASFLPRASKSHGCLSVIDGKKTDLPFSFQGIGCQAGWRLVK